MFVADWMSRTPKSIRESAPLYDAYRLLLEHDFRHLPVTDAKDRLVGIISQNDLMVATERAIELSKGELSYVDAMKAERIIDHMTAKPISVEPGETIEDAALLLREYKIGALPVVHGGKLVGILTETDILTVLIESLGLERGGARMVHEISEDQSNAKVRRILDTLDHDRLHLTSLATYRPRGGGPLRLVARVRGAVG